MNMYIKQSIFLISFLMVFLLQGCGGSSSSSSASTSTITGKSGSLAQYAVVGDYLYTVNSGVMDILDISDASKPKKLSKVRLPWDVETLFAYKNYLYIGGENGVYIYDNTNPLVPKSISEFSHVQSCDPVVVSDDIAFVTLNSSDTCWNGRDGVNRLDILDVSNPSSPKLIKSVDMWEPTGLGVDGNKLFICDGDSGLKVFEIIKDNNTSSQIDLVLKSSDATINCYDLITDDGVLIVSNRKNIRQFNYRLSPMEELGRIEKLSVE